MGLNPLPSPVNVVGGGVAVGRVPRRRGRRERHPSEGELLGAPRPDAVPTAAKATGMYINSSLAKVEALRAGYDEAVMLTTDGYVSEGTGENIFLVRDGRDRHAAELRRRGARGDHARARSADRRATSATRSREELHASAPTSISPTRRSSPGPPPRWCPIASVDDRAVGSGKPGPITKAIQQTYFADRARRGDRYKDWLDYVD